MSRKIYNEVILQWNDETNQFDTVYEDSYEYDGPLDMAQDDPDGLDEDALENVRDIYGEINHILGMVDIKSDSIDRKTAKLAKNQSKILSAIIKQANTLEKGSKAYKKYVDMANEYANTLNVILDETSEVKDLESELVRLKQLGNTVDTRSAQILVRKHMMIKKMQSSFEAIDDATGNIATNIVKFMTSPLTAILGIVAGIWKLFMQHQDRLKMIGKEWGAIGQSSEAIKTNARALDKQLRFINMDLEEIVPNIHDIESSFGMSTIKAMELAGSLAMSAREMGVGVDSVVTLATTLGKVTDISDENLGLAIETLGYFADMSKVAPRAVIEDMAENTEAWAKYSFKGQKSLFRAAVAAKRLGASMSDMDQMAENIMDWETSIANEMTLSQMLGREINFDEARRAMMLEGMPGFIKEMADELGDVIKLNETDFYLMKQIQETLGVSDQIWMDIIRKVQGGLSPEIDLVNKKLEESVIKAKAMDPSDAQTSFEEITASLDALTVTLEEEFLPLFKKFENMLKRGSGILHQWTTQRFPELVEWAKLLLIIWGGFKIGAGLKMLFSAFGAGGVLSFAPKMLKGIWNWVKKIGLAAGGAAFGIQSMASGGSGLGNYAPGATSNLARGPHTTLPPGHLKNQMAKNAANAGTKVPKGGGIWKSIKGAFSSMKPSRIVSKMVKGGLIGALINSALAANVLAGDGNPEEKASELLRLSGSILGGMGGSLIAGFLGSIIPVAGTAAGVISGGIAGSFIGDWIMSSSLAQKLLRPMVADAIRGMGSTSKTDELTEQVKGKFKKTNAFVLTPDGTILQPNNEDFIYGSKSAPGGSGAMSNSDKAFLARLMGSTRQKVTIKRSEIDYIQSHNF